MTRRLLIVAASLLVAAQAMANYVVVLKSGTRYRAKSKWTVVNGKAMVNLENGSTIQLDPALIDEAMSEQVTSLGLGDAHIISSGQPTDTAPQKPKPSLGSMTHLRPMPGTTTPPTTAPATTKASPRPDTPSSPPPLPANTTGARLGDDVIQKFTQAYENVGIFEQKITSTGPGSLRVELTADNEEKVFNAISATSFLIVHNAGIAGVNMEMVELFMKTTTGGAAGRFQMSRADADALDKKTISQQDYFIRKVIY